jgi:hypothetical protein
MAIPFYLAQTGAEFHCCQPRPDKIGWMACHFSSYGTGVSNLPPQLPEGSLLILNDRTPVRGHDPQRIFEQLSETIRRHRCSGLLMDFQRAGEAGAASIAAALAALPCPVAVSDCYAEGLSGAVFLSPPELWTPVDAWLAPWAGREIWAEAVCQQAVVRITEDGSSYGEVPFGDEDWKLQEERFLSWEVTKGDGVLSVGLRRGPEELKKWMEQAEKLGVKRFFGLYQQSSCGIDN